MHIQEFFPLFCKILTMCKKNLLQLNFQFSFFLILFGHLIYLLFLTCYHLYFIFTSYYRFHSIVCLFPVGFWININVILLIQFSCSIVSDSLRPTATCQASQSITNSWTLLKLMSLSWRCHPTISSSVVPFWTCLQSFPASGSFPMCQFFTSGGQSIGVLASALVLPTNVQGLISLRMDWLDFLAVQGTLQSLL